MSNYRLLEQACHNVEVSNLFGSSVSLVTEQDTHFGIHDYQRWLTIMNNQARNNGLNLDNQKVFRAVARNVLENDSRLNLIGADSNLRKNQMVRELWLAHKSHQVGGLPPSNNAKEDEEIMVPKFAITRANLDGSTSYFAGMDHGNLLWTNNPNEAYAYHDQNAATSAIRMLLHDMSAYPGGREGKAAGQPKYKFGVVPVERPYNPQEREYRRVRYENEEQERSYISTTTNTGHKSPEDMMYEAAYHQGMEAARTDYLSESNNMTKNPYASGTLRHEAWSEGYHHYGQLRDAAKHQP